MLLFDRPSVSIVSLLRKRNNVLLSHCCSSANVIEPREPHTCNSIIQGKDWVLSPYVLSSCGLPLPLTSLLVTVNEARSYFASTIHGAISQKAVVFSPYVFPLFWVMTPFVLVGRKRRFGEMTSTETINMLVIGIELRSK
jgi:hypothetical protein